MTIRWKSGNLISGKSDVTCSINNDFTRIRIYSYNSLLIQKNIHFFKKNENNYYYNIFLEKGLHEDKSNKYFLKINVCVS